MRVTITVGATFMFSIYLRALAKPNSWTREVLTIIAEAFEIATVVIGSSFIGLTDFTTIQTLYTNLRRTHQAHP